MGTQRKPRRPRTKKTLEEISHKLNLTIPEAAKLMGMSTNMINDLCGKGELVTFPVGKRRRIITSSLIDFQNRLASAG